MSNFKSEDQNKFVAFILEDPNAKNLSVVCREIFKDNDPEYDAANNIKYCVKTITASTQTEVTYLANKFIQEYLNNKPLSDFNEIRKNEQSRIENSKGSYIKYEDGSTLVILPEE